MGCRCWFAVQCVYVVHHSAKCLCLLDRSFPSEVISRNPFVETALTYTLNYVSSVAGPRTIKASRITILADSDYYSQPGKAISESSIGSRQFLDFGVRLQDAHKTGLGSSAALVSAFTGAVLSHYLSSPQFDLSSARDKALLHNLAQAAHCAAQGKVGSGFDIAAAVYGTCIYRRFSPSTLSVLGEPTSFQFAKRLRYLVEDTNPEHKWDAEIKKNDVKIPDGMVLMMCDVDCGSETVGMVKKVLGWRKQDPSGAKVLWDQLQQENEGLAKGLLSGDPRKLSESFFKIRAHIRDMGERSGVPIEPPEQTALLDAVTDSVKGVYGGVVPGAGGYDAVVLLVKDDEETLSQLHSFLKEWSSFKGSSVKLLGAKGEMEGIKKEDEEMYRVWIK